MDLFWTSYARLIYVLCPGGLGILCNLRYLSSNIHREKRFYVIQEKILS